MDGVKIRDYESKDEEALKELERVANQTNSRFVDGHVVYMQEITTKASQYEQWFVLVAESPTEESEDMAVCATIMCGIKLVVLKGKQVKVGYVFDLRVHPNFRRIGVGSALSNEVELRCRIEKVCLLYLTVNGNNKKAQNLYKKIGYSEASIRKPAINFLINPKHVPKVAIEKLSPTDAAKAITSAYITHDMCLVNMQSLVASPQYIGTFLATHKDHPEKGSACISLWDGNAILSLNVTRIFLPISWYISPAMKLGLLSLLIPTFAWIFNCGRGMYNDNEMVKLSFLSVLCGVGSYLIHKGLSFANWVFHSMLDKDSRDKWRCRLFAPYYEGASGEELMKELLRYVHNYGHNSGYLMTICNIGENDRVRKVMPSSKFHTIFMKKSLSEDCKGVVEFSPDLFFDPRDI